MVKKDQNNRSVPLEPPSSWLAKESLKFGHSLYLCFPLLLALVGVCPEAIFAPFSLGQAGYLYECGGGYFNKEELCNLLAR